MLSIEKSKINSSIELLRKAASGRDLDADKAGKIKDLLDRDQEELEDLLSLSLYKELDADKDEMLSEHYENMSGFRERLFETWKVPLKRLDSLLYLGMEVVGEFRRDNVRNPKAKSNKFNVATRLLARCVQVGNEISHLLHGGYADGAFARWRTLHETSATTKFICEGGEDLATRFIDFQNILRLDTATKYNKYNELEFESFSPEILAQLEVEKKAILGKYEQHFEKKFGWARKALGDKVNHKDNLSFTNIEEFVGLGFLRNHFGFASQYVHAGVDSIGFKLGTSMSNRDVLLTGPSNEGFIEPIQCTSLSLVYAIAALISAYSNDASPLKVAVLWRWHDVLKEEVLAASSALQAKADALRNSIDVK